MKPEIIQLIETARATRDNLAQLTSAEGPQRLEILAAAHQLGVTNRAMLSAALVELAGDTAADSGSPA